MVHNIARRKLHPIYLSISLLYTLFLCRKIYVVSQSEFIMSIVEWLEIPLYLILVYSIIKRNKLTKKLLIGVVSSIVSFLLMVYYSGLAEFLKATLIILAFKNCELKRLAKSFTRISVSIILITFVLYVLGISDAGVMRRGFLAYGFKGGNALGQVCFFLTIQAIISGYTLRRDIKVALLITNIVCFILSNGRACAILSIIAILLINNRVVSLFTKKFFKVVTYILPILSTIGTFTVTLLYPSSSFVQKMDRLFSARILLNYRNLILFGIKPFGQKIQVYTTDVLYYNDVTKTYSTFNTIDNAYMMGFISMGFIIMLVVYLFYYLLVKKIYKDEQYNLIGVIICLCIFGLVDTLMLSIYVSIPFFYLTSRKGCFSIRKKTQSKYSRAI